MGTYAGYQGKTRIAKRDQTAFSRQMVKILNYGGMMGFDVVYALDHEIGLLRPAKLYPGGKTIFYYNYFEDESWELAEYDSKTCSLWTEKVGSGQFADVVLAAYMLYCIYDDFRGTVGYTGSIVAKLYNHSGIDYKVNAGDKITQLVIVPILTPELELVEALEETERGNNGFGSTGK